MSVVLVTLQRSICQASGTDSPCEICQDGPTAIYLRLQVFSLQPCVLSPSPQFPLNCHKMMSLIEMPSESRLIALLYLCLPHSAHRVWDDRSLQCGCLRRSVRCVGWTQEGCLLLLSLMDPLPTDKC